MFKMSNHFNDLADGLFQVPRQPVRTQIRDLITDRDVLEYHDLMVKEMGGLFSHFLASIPFILEEMAHLGSTLTKLSNLFHQEKYSFYEIDAFDGSNGRTLAKHSNGLVRTFTNSPNKSNKKYFVKYANPEYSEFYSGTFWDINKSFLIANKIKCYSSLGFDYIYETAAFQFYGKDRNRQIRHVSELLRKDGLFFLLEKLSSPDIDDYEYREKVKDEKFKIHYFTPEEIKWKRQKMLLNMQEGQVTFEELVYSLRNYFEHIYLLWNSTNFYEFVASNSQEKIEEFIELYEEPYIPNEFCFEKHVVRRVAF